MRNRLLTASALMGATLLSAGCGTAGLSPASEALDRQAYCAGWQPLPMRQVVVDTMNDAEFYRWAGHNENGREEGCW